MLSHTSAFQGADEQTRRRLFMHGEPHSPSRSQTCHQMCPILENRTTTPHVSCPTCPIRAKRTTTMLISRSTCPILEKRTSKQPKNTRWMSETPESDTQSVAPLEFLRKIAGSRMAPSYGSPQGFLPPRVAPLEFLRKMAARHADLRLRRFWCRLVDCLRAWRNGRRAVFRWQ